MADYTQTTTGRPNVHPTTLPPLQEPPRAVANDRSSWVHVVAVVAVVGIVAAVAIGVVNNGPSADDGAVAPAAMQVTPTVQADPPEPAVEPDVTPQEIPEPAPSVVPAPAPEVEPTVEPEVPPLEEPAPDPEVIPTPTPDISN
jgi:hypothetical protein